jgi:hypothetical protein
MPREATVAEARAREVLSEDGLLRELGLLYNYRDSDERQFTRWQMTVAIRHGYRLAEETARAREAEAYARGLRDGQREMRERAADVARAYPMHSPFGDSYEASGMIRKGQDGAREDIAVALADLPIKEQSHDK